MAVPGCACSPIISTAPRITPSTSPAATPVRRSTSCSTTTARSSERTARKTPRFGSARPNGVRTYPTRTASRRAGMPLRSSAATALPANPREAYQAVRPARRPIDRVQQDAAARGIAAADGARAAARARDGGAAHAGAPEADIADRAGVLIVARSAARNRRAHAAGAGLTRVGGAGIAVVAVARRSAARPALTAVVLRAQVGVVAPGTVGERGVHASLDRIAIARAAVAVVTGGGRAGNAHPGLAGLDAVAHVAVVAVGVRRAPAAALARLPVLDPTHVAGIARDAVTGAGDVAARCARVTLLAGAARP